MMFDKEQALLAVDGLIAHALTVKAIIENTDPEDRCRHEKVMWVADGSGMCRSCGEEFPAGTYVEQTDVGVSPDLPT